MKLCEECSGQGNYHYSNCQFGAAIYEDQMKYEHISECHSDYLSPDYNDYSNESLLEMLAQERSKFTKANKSLMKEMIDELVDRKVYPTEWNGKAIDVYARVEGWGAYWHQWTGVLNCPECGADLRCPGGPPFKTCLGVYDRGSDRTTHYKCPSCPATWSRAEEDKA